MPHSDFFSFSLSLSLSLPFFLFSTYFYLTGGFSRSDLQELHSHFSDLLRFHSTTTWVAYLSRYASVATPLGQAPRCTDF
ncbi:hypothetical protein LZ31DRAFT_32883 [Colletotrichum somersetense]|nr:hypothetical protein LZ31DRAFT_32883 [Colletotrichum somersetense]